jgi:hypothetical protein
MIGEGKKKKRKRMPMYRGQPCSYQRPYAKPYAPYLNGPIGITNLQRIVICHLGGT